MIPSGKPLVYVAAKFEDVERVRAMYERIREAGSEITFDWTGETDERQGAIDDLEGVRRAHVVVVLPHPAGKGLYAELGAALALGKPVVVVGDERAPALCVFQRHPLCHWVRRDEYAVPAIRRLVERRRDA